MGQAFITRRGGADVRRMFILQISFSTYFVGSSFTVSGGGFSYTGTVPANAEVIMSVPTANTTYTISSGAYSSSVFVGSAFGIYRVSLLSSLSEFSWSQIAAVSSAGTAANIWKVGDKKNITLSTNEVLTLQIWGFNHDDLATGGKAGVTFGLNNLMGTMRRINANNTNVGGFTGSEIFPVFNETILTQLPTDLQSVLKTVNKKTSAGNMSSTINTNAMKIFPPSEIECFGFVTTSFVGEGVKYPIFTDNPSRIKLLNNGSGAASMWWTRSPETGAGWFCAVSNTGSASGTGTSASSGVCFAFCV